MLPYSFYAVTYGLRSNVCLRQEANKLVYLILPIITAFHVVSVEHFYVAKIIRLVKATSIAVVGLRCACLSRIFAIKACAYAVMSNHTHVVLYVDADTAESWSTEEVLSRWHQLHKGTMLTQQYMMNGSIPEYLQSLLDETATTYRQRLMDISWFIL